ncbi:hypothetical protein BFS14_08305 [Serratia fonticola]|nr:hypothetical protein BFS14_08305 [Serratia fonticola]
MGIQQQKYVSNYQHLLIEKKLENKITKDWSNPKFMSFLYAKFIHGDQNTNHSSIVKKPKRKIRRKVNFEQKEMP